MTPTPEELRAIGTLKRHAKKWPKSLWLFAASGTLCVMQKRKGERVMKDSVRGDGGVDSDYTAATIGIECDGGDW